MTVCGREGRTAMCGVGVVVKGGPVFLVMPVCEYLKGRKIQFQLNYSDCTERVASYVLV